MNGYSLLFHLLVARAVDGIPETGYTIGDVKRQGAKQDFSWKEGLSSRRMSTGPTFRKVVLLSSGVQETQSRFRGIQVCENPY